MNPTKAPWADAPPAAAAAGPAGPNRHTGKPVRPLIDTEAQLPTVDPASWPATWQPAHKRIRSQQDVDAAIKGATLRSFIAFCISLNQSVVGKKLSDPCPVSPAAAATLAALDRLLGFIDEVPPATHEVRYGNPAYRAWFQKLQDAAPELVLNILGDERGPATIELLPYFLDSFGNRTRIDYGTGHETNFVAFLFCLYALGALGAEDQQATVTRVFKKYLDLMRKLQTTYWLEPAGSHGVWGLDEYHFFPFIWGAAQLQGHDLVRPTSVTNDDTLEAYAPEYLYLDAVRFVRSVKKGPLHETSPMLYDISGVPNWTKVNQGMFKMYQVEVLSKLPIMQHWLWGSLLPFPGS